MPLTDMQIWALNKFFSPLGLKVNGIYQLTLREGNKRKPVDTFSVEFVDEKKEITLQDMQKALKNLKYFTCIDKIIDGMYTLSLATNCIGLNENSIMEKFSPNGKREIEDTFRSIIEKLADMDKKTKKSFEELNATKNQMAAARKAISVAKAPDNVLGEKRMTPKEMREQVSKKAARKLKVNLIQKKVPSLIDAVKQHLIDLLDYLHESKLEENKSLDNPEGLPALPGVHLEDYLSTDLLYENDHEAFIDKTPEFHKAVGIIAGNIVTQFMSKQLGSDKENIDTNINYALQTGLALMEENVQESKLGELEPMKMIISELEKFGTAISK